MANKILIALLVVFPFLFKANASSAKNVNHPTNISQNIVADSTK